MVGALALLDQICALDPQTQFNEETKLANRMRLEALVALYTHLSSSYHSLSLETPHTAPMLGDFPSDGSRLDLDILAGKIGRCILNFYTVVHTSKYGWEESQLEYDIIRLHGWVDFYCRQELNKTLKEIFDVTTNMAES
jgi:hypothetical protein